LTSKWKQFNIDVIFGACNNGARKNAPLITGNPLDHLQQPQYLVTEPWETDRKAKINCFQLLYA
jgi:hypothetical protein